MERNLNVANDLLSAFRDAMQNDWVLCITCFVSGFAMIIWYRIWLRRKGK